MVICIKQEKEETEWKVKPTTREYISYSNADKIGKLKYVQTYCKYLVKLPHMVMQIKITMVKLTPQL